MSQTEILIEVLVYVGVMALSFMALALAVVGVIYVCYRLLGETVKYAIRMRKGHIYSHYGRRK